MPTKDELRERITEYLDMTGRSHGKGQSFRCANPAHADNNPSMSYDADSHRVHCFSCNATYDLFDLIRIDFGLDNFGDQFKKACEIFRYPTGSHGDADSSRDLPGIFFLTGKNFFFKGDSDDSVIELIRKAWKNRKKAAEYMQSRGIPVALTERYGIGFYYGYRIIGKSCNAVVFPVAHNAYMVRNTDTDSTPRYYKYGKPFPIWNLDAIGMLGKGKPLFVTEGIIDAMSIIACGGTAVALNGTENVGSLVSAISEVFPDGNADLTVIAACDKDEPGRKANRKLADALQAIRVRCLVPDLYGSHKDANEALLQDRDAFTGTVHRLQTESGLNSVLHQETESDAVFLDGYMDVINQSLDEPFVRTGFSALDNALHGGLRPGFYVLGAIPSVGKTTLLVQLRDGFCQQKRTVLFFSLETSLLQITAKSISRLTYELDREHALDTLQVSDGRLVENLGDKEMAVFRSALGTAKDFLRYCTTFEGGDNTLEKIQEIVEDYISRTGEKPVIMIDYLQLVQTARRFPDERSRVSEIARQLGALSMKYNLPILAISTINRENYNKTLSYESYMATSSIEFGAYCLMGLQYTGTGSRSFNQQAAENAEVRRMDLVVIKLKNSVKNLTVHLDYNPKFNIFTESAETVPDTTTETKTVNISVVRTNQPVADVPAKPAVNDAVNDSEFVMDLH